MVEASSTSHKKDEIKAASDALPDLERIQDPYNDRPMKDVPKPPRYPMSSKELYHEKGKTMRNCLLSHSL
jgi:hypothetical protein